MESQRVKWNKVEHMPYDYNHVCCHPSRRACQCSFVGGGDASEHAASGAVQCSAACLSSIAGFFFFTIFVPVIIVSIKNKEHHHRVEARASATEHCLRRFASVVILQAFTLLSRALLLLPRRHLKWHQISSPCFSATLTNSHSLRTPHSPFQKLSPPSSRVSIRPLIFDIVYV